MYYYTIIFYKHNNDIEANNVEQNKIENHLSEISVGYIFSMCSLCACFCASYSRFILPTDDRKEYFKKYQQ